MEVVIRHRRNEVILVDAPEGRTLWFHSSSGMSQNKLAYAPVVIPGVQDSLEQLRGTNWRGGTSSTKSEAVIWYTALQVMRHEAVEARAGQSSSGRRLCAFPFLERGVVLLRVRRIVGGKEAYHTVCPPRHASVRSPAWHKRPLAQLCP